MTIDHALRIEVGEARAVAMGVREAAQACGPAQAALRLRLTGAANTIERLCSLIEREQVRISLKVSR